MLKGRKSLLWLGSSVRSERSPVKRNVVGSKPTRASIKDLSAIFLLLREHGVVGSNPIFHGLARKQLSWQSTFIAGLVFRAVAQLVSRANLISSRSVVQVHPARPPSLEDHFHTPAYWVKQAMRHWYNGRARAFQARDAGPIPACRSKPRYVSNFLLKQYFEAPGRLREDKRIQYYTWLRRLIVAI